MLRVMVKLVLGSGLVGCQGKFRVGVVVRPNILLTLNPNPP